MRCSIVIVSYQGRDDLAHCLASVVASKGERDEVLVVDNASSDGSAEMVRERFPAVRVLANQSNAGFGSAANRGAREAHGEYLVFLNPDTIVEPTWLEPLVAALERDARAGMATSGVLLMDTPDRINAYGNDVHMTGLALCHALGRPRADRQAPAPVAAVSGAAFAMRRTLFDQLGGFDEAFFLYVEDTDLSLRARLLGYDIVCVPESVVLHDYRLTVGPQKTFFQERNRYRMLLKTFEWRTLALLSPALLLAELVTWGFVLLEDRRNWTNKLRAYRWTLAHRNETLALRRRVQSTRRISDGELLAVLGTRLDYGQARGGPAARAAALVFDPAFALLRRLVSWLTRTGEP